MYSRVLRQPLCKGPSCRTHLCVCRCGGMLAAGVHTCVQCCWAMQHTPRAWCGVDQQLAVLCVPCGHEGAIGQTSPLPLRGRLAGGLQAPQSTSCRCCLAGCCCLCASSRQLQWEVELCGAAGSRAACCTERMFGSHLLLLLASSAGCNVARL